MSTPTVSPAAAPGPPVRRRLLETAEGTSSGAFDLRDWGLLALIAFIWGSSFLWMDIGLDHLAPGVVTFLRIALGAAALAVFPKARVPLPREDWPAVALLGLVSMAIPLTLFPIAQQWVDSALAGMINGGVPLTTAAVATLLLRRLPGRAQLAGLAVGFVGIVTISLPQVGTGGTTALGTVLLICAITLYGIATNLLAPLQQRHGSLPVILRAQLVALALVAPYALVGLPDSTFAWSSTLAMVPLGILSTGFAYIALGALIGRVGSSRGTIPIYFTPVVAILLGIAFRNDRLTVWAGVGMALVLLGTWLASRAERPRAAPVVVPAPPPAG